MRILPLIACLALAGCASQSSNSPQKEAAVRQMVIAKMLKDGKIRRQFVDEIDREEVALGMNPMEVILAWGEPDKVNKTVSAMGYQEQAVYRRGNYRAQFVHMTNGRVTYISEM